MSLKGIIKSGRNYLKENGPEILTGIGIVGGVTSTVLAVKATPKALRLIEERKAEQGVEQLTVVDTVKSTWKCYIPAALTGSLSICCLIYASSTNAKRQTALLAAYKLSETTFAEYREAVKETVSEKEQKKIQEKVVDNKIEKLNFEEKDIIVTGYGTTLCVDAFTGQPFYSDLEYIRRCYNVLNTYIRQNDYASLGWLYSKLGLNDCTAGDVLGWDATDGDVYPDTYARMWKDGRPCIMVEFSIRPKTDYDFVG